MTPNALGRRRTPSSVLTALMLLGLLWLMPLAAFAGFDQGESAPIFLVDWASLEPQVSSSTHPDTIPRLNPFTAQVNLGLVSDDAVSGYRYVVDGTPDTIPAASSSFSAAQPITRNGITPGSRWFHVRAVNSLGAMTDTAHYPFSVYACTTHPDPNRYYFKSTFSVNWGNYFAHAAPPAAGYLHLIDQQPATAVTIMSGTYTTAQSLTTNKATNGVNFTAGVWYFHMAAANAAGDIIAGSQFNLPFRVATDAPSVTSTSHPSSTAMSLNRDFRGTAASPAVSGAVGTYHYVFDQDPDTVPTVDDPASPTGVLSKDNLALGTHYCHVIAVDAAGNVSPASHYQFIVGSAPPEITSSTHPDPSGSYPGRDVTVSWTAGGVPGVVRYYRAFTTSAGTTPTQLTTDTTWTIPNVAIGSHWVHIQSEDAYGNKSPVGHFQVNIRAARGPAVSLAVSSSGNNLQFTWTDPENFASGNPAYYWVFDQASGTEPTASSDSTNNTHVNRLGVANGVHFFHIRSRDRHGNFSETQHVLAVVGNVLLSLNGPDPTLTTGGRVTYQIVYPGASNITLIDRDVTLNKTGTANGIVRITNSTNPLMKNIEVHSTTGDGTISISVAAGTATYANGVQAPAVPNTTPFTVDNTPPGITVGAPSLAVTATRPVTYTVTYSGNPSLVSLRREDVHIVKTGTAHATNIDVAGSGLSSRTITLSGFSGDGTLGIQINFDTARDAAGNSAPAAAGAHFNVDSTPPRPTIGNPDPAAENTGPVRWLVSYPEPVTFGERASKIHMVVTGTVTGMTRPVAHPTNPNQWYIEAYNLLGDGNLSVAIDEGTAHDNAGNPARQAGPSAPALIDNTGPIVTIGPPVASESPVTAVTFSILYTDDSPFTVTLKPEDVLLNTTNDVKADIRILPNKSLSDTRTVSLENITGQGKLGISLRANTARDNVGNPSIAVGPSATIDINGYRLVATPEPAASGVIGLAPAGGYYAKGTSVSLTPTANSGWRFLRWSGDLTGSSAPGSVVMNGNRNVVGHFIAQVGLTMAVTPSGAGTTTPAVGTTIVDEGTVVSISPTANSNWRFDHWDGPVASPASANTTVKVDVPMTVTACFVRQYTLTMVAQPGDKGTTTPAVGGTKFDTGTVVNVSARPAPGQAFHYWQGDVADPNAETTTTVMTGDKTLVAHFVPGYSLTMNILPAQSGSTLPPAGVYAYPQGGTVTIEARATQNWQFDHWTGNVANAYAAVTTIVMSGDKTVTAHFKPIFTLEMAVSPAGGGTTIPAPGTHKYVQGATVQLQAQPASGWQFDHWTGNVANTATPNTSFIVNSNATVTAVFVEKSGVFGCSKKSSKESQPQNASGDLVLLGGVVAALASARKGGRKSGLSRWQR